MNENKAINMQIPFTNIAITQLSAHQCINSTYCFAMQKNLFGVPKEPVLHGKRVVPHRKTATSITLKHYYKFP